jgi:hypothetical protein
MAFDDYNIERIVSKLVERDLQGLRDERLPDAFRIGELLYDVELFNYNLSWQKEHWKKVLCIDLKMAGALPALVSLHDPYGRRYTYPIFSNFFMREFGQRVMEETLNDMKLPVYFTNAGNATEFFRDNLGNFIRTRLFGLNNSESVSPAGRLPFTVHTQANNLRVLYSPVYLFGGGDVFGYPSTPVAHEIKPGAYIFGAEGVGRPSVWEANRIYHVPNDNQATLITI